MVQPSSSNSNSQERNEQRAAAIAGFGFTERQARFLVTVMVHAGVFVERQYCAFANIVHGQKTHDFVERRHVTMIEVGPRHQGRMFHVGYKPLYAAIGQTDNRHRKPAPAGKMVERLMLLDAVLDCRTLTWLGRSKTSVGIFRDASVLASSSPSSLRSDSAAARRQRRGTSQTRCRSESSQKRASMCSSTWLQARRRWISGSFCFGIWSCCAVLDAGRFARSSRVRLRRASASLRPPRETISPRRFRQQPPRSWCGTSPRGSAASSLAPTSWTSGSPERVRRSRGLASARCTGTGRRAATAPSGPRRLRLSKTRSSVETVASNSLL